MKLRQNHERRPKFNFNVAKHSSSSGVEHQSGAWRPIGQTHNSSYINCSCVGRSVSLHFSTLDEKDPGECSGSSSRLVSRSMCHRAGHGSVRSRQQIRKRQRKDKEMIAKVFSCLAVHLIFLIGSAVISHTTQALRSITPRSFCVTAFNPVPTLLNSPVHRVSSRYFLNSNARQSEKAQTSSSLFFSTDAHQVNEASSPTKEDSRPTNPAATPSLSSSNEYSFFDEATIYVRAGSGGQGSSTYKKGVNNQNGPPDGGNGGRGGSVILQLDESLNTLAGLARYAWRPNSFGGGGGAKRRGDGETTTNRVLTFRAENGADGGRQNRQGRNGKDIIVRVPPGTVVQEECLLSPAHAYREENEKEGADCAPTYKDLGTVTHANPTLTIATGGQGGEGSALHSSLQRGVRRPRSPPQGGERKRLKLTLKVVADVALVAVPNAGKSTLLSKVTRAKPKIADYPFTTVVPNLGVWVPSKDFDSPDDEDQYDTDGSMAPSNSKSLILCDVPGLIAGASDGVGLGHAFLRHVERCHVILHLLDATSEKVLEEYAMINKELLRYGTGKLALMPQVVVVNKVDVAFGDCSDEKEARKSELELKLKNLIPHSRLMWISAKEGEGVDDLMERVAMFVRKVKEVSAREERADNAEN
ncbi:hypothetical protein HJC23_006451 [Cyclotella cryptica]|uniref:Uncharacterized protein n=1 Tax=Cyclotella cryptica TaxID=29204 RepID=A0ABD3R0R5_9STRA|eukprot:CCRYP_001858-RA/>CCRYP_001858-RA protein AED:0.03 eAED:0.03 QI:221/1/1/1/0.5/0.4/5/1114/641